MSVAIVEASSSDEALVLDGAYLFDNPVQPVGLKRFLSDPRHILLLAVDRARPVGFLTAVELFHPDRATPELFINEIGVADDRHREGIGRALVERLIRTATDRGATATWVLAEAENSGANAFYRELGAAGTDAKMYEFVPKERP